MASASAIRRSRSASVWPGSWWNGTRCLTPASVPKASVCSSELCPQPTCARILVRAVLAVVDQQVGAGGERAARRPLARQRRKAQRPERGLVVGQVGEHAASRVGDAIADRRPGMADERRRDAEFADLDVAARHLVERDLRTAARGGSPGRAAATGSASGARAGQRRRSPVPRCGPRCRGGRAARRSPVPGCGPCAGG